VPYTDSGTYTYHFIGANGCDSSSTLILKVNRPTSATIDVPMCWGEKYWINGVAYSTAGTYVVHLTNVAGCDSTVTLNISIVTHKEKSVAVQICSGESYVFGDTTITQAGVYTRRFLSYVGCDSIVTLTLTVNPSYSSSQSVTLVYGDTYAINEHVYNKQGTYTDVFKTADGCDSTVTTDLRYVLTLCPDVVVPPFFSPNGDGFNDFLEIENLSCYTKSTVEIFDRYGKRVAHYSGTSLGWDGYYLGHPQPSSDYWYLITLPESGKRLTGHFTLKR
jgi:gliding motility-associated-like protein